MSLVVCVTFFIVTNYQDVVIFDPLKTLYMTGSHVTVRCVITVYELSPPIATKVNYRLYNNNTVFVSFRFPITGTQKYPIKHTISTLKLSDAGQYTCVNSLSSDNPFIKPSDTKIDTTNITVQSMC